MADDHPAAATPLPDPVGPVDPDPRDFDDALGRASRAHFAVEESADRQAWPEVEASAAALAAQAARLVKLARAR